MGFYDPHRIQARVARRQRIGAFLKPYVSAGLGAISMSGMGDYSVNYNSIMKVDGANSEANYVPSLSDSPYSKSVRICHREYIQDVLSSTGFANTSFQLNPANAICFPWLSAMAQNFQEYRFHGIVFYFNSTSADALSSTNTALGTVIMSTDYNSANTPFASKQAAENSEFTVSTKPCNSLVHGIECDPARTINAGHLYVSPYNNGTIPAGQDIKTYNLGNFQIMTQGSQAVANIGELWVSYDVELIKPTDNSQLNRSAADHWYGANPNPGAGGAGYLFGSTITKKQNGVGCTLASAAGSSSITWPATAIPGQVYLITWYTEGSATAATAGNWTITNLDAVQAFGNGAVSDSRYYAFSVPVAGQTATSTVNQWLVKISSTAGIGSLPVLTLTTSWNQPYSGTTDIVVTQMPGLFNS